MRGLVVAMLCASGCNAVLGLDPTELVNDNPRAIVFDNRASTRDLVDFPVVVRLDPTRIDYDQVIDPGTDLRFHDPTTDTDLPFEVEEWVPGGTSTVWVLVPHITARTSTERMLMYFGTLANSSGQAPAQVWKDYQVVVHGGATYQSAPGGITATATGVTAIEGAVGPAMKLGGTGRHEIDFSNSLSLFGGWNTFTVELWVYADYASGALPNEPRIISLYQPLTSGRLFPLSPPFSTYVMMQIDFQFSNGTVYDPTFMPLQRWAHMLFTYDGSTLWIYRNGALAGLDPIGASGLRSTTDNLVLGGPMDVLEGMIDEVRISRTYRDDEWIAAQFLAMNGGFVTFATPGQL